ncbi:MAG: hypothetical protein KatS3mg091_129 [Patescibacteria group bacterium]|nr:MAG: hypothetical protein KatS3mg091_129 [Patescibacteria group bacterium]
MDSVWAKANDQNQKLEKQLTKLNQKINKIGKKTLDKNIDYLYQQINKVKDSLANSLKPDLKRMADYLEQFYKSIKTGYDQKLIVLI